MPFAVAFIDIRMPPGIDGRENGTAHQGDRSGHSPGYRNRLFGLLPGGNRKGRRARRQIFYIAKPFEVSEIQQMALALCRRWDNDRELSAARALLAEKVATLEEKSAELEANESRAMHLAMHERPDRRPNRAAFLRGLTERGGRGHPS